MEKYIKNDFRLVGVPLIILLIISALILVSINTIYQNFTSLNDNLMNANTQENALKTKLTSLEKVSQEISNESQAAVLALPPQNSILNAVKEIRGQSLFLNLTVKNLESNNIPTKAGDIINQTQLNFEIEGNFTNLASLILKIKNSTPLTHFDTIKFDNQNVQGGNYRLNADLISYWAPLPSTIPAITDPITELSPDEKTLLTKISNLTVPVEVSASQSASPVGAGKTNPFQ